MYFKKLELVGFKSFCDKTVLEFEPGITAVVGPNGCGKSNIFDSIRWVLGEQSAKSLRGSEMMDVIFNGADNKEPLSMAEVSLSFDNQNRFFNIDHPELVITRRIFRSGESEYMINKSTVRLKDILDLLLGTGIGAESYSIVAQGKIDLVLSSRPDDRRLVFDEASGITRYKAQKRETMRKLDETQQNLLRVNDIVVEVKRQIGSLERQANKARRYKEVFEELKIKEIDAAVLEKNALLKQKEELINSLAGLGQVEATLLENIRQQEEKISNRQSELKAFEDKMMALKIQVLNLENSLVRNDEHIKFDQDRIAEINSNREILKGQIDQARVKLSLDLEKLEKVKAEHDSIQQVTQEKNAVLAQKEEEINGISAMIKGLLEDIVEAKKSILEIATQTASAKNEIGDFTSKHQVFLARKKRLGIEKAKVFEEKAITEENYKKVAQELEILRQALAELNQKISGVKDNLSQEGANLDNINAEISNLENEKLMLVSHKEFLEKLKNKYDDIGESLNAVIYLDKMPQESVSGLVVKVNVPAASDISANTAATEGFKLSGEAKPIELDTTKIDEKIKNFEERLGELRSKKILRETYISELSKTAEALSQELRNQEISLANKESNFSAISEQFNKIKEEEDVIVMELGDVSREISVLEQNLADAGNRLTSLNARQRQIEDKILEDEDVISSQSKLREIVLVVITQTKTEIEALTKRLTSDAATLKIIQETCVQDNDAMAHIQKQLSEGLALQETLKNEISECQKNKQQALTDINQNKEALTVMESEYELISSSTVEVAKKIEADRKQMDTIKSQLHDFQMQDKDIDYRYANIKERMLNNYKVELEIQNLSAENLEQEVLTAEITKLKEKLDSYGTVNLVAIEEYDELKQRYDFLIQQQTDLNNAKESLHQAILKINRTTKQMFMDTFEKVKVEFRNYFRLLFNGGDAQLFLVDEADPLESGIEIICRPPGKKLQNVLLLSGGEKSMSAIALIFAIFKVKPSPFCILDEIDAALDEANVDRFSRILQEFAKTSQFIVVTHNKKTIANANVMYGITMQQSGVSKIVSVKFSQSHIQKEAPVEEASQVKEAVA
ncbi:MAG: AAA family ATPase [Candidatus Omnitrophica bacterium]|jgi:chromosome segregation protein|nr:AAA family ATPase [Candidatus Omnitrophota bacterium]